MNLFVYLVIKILNRRKETIHLTSDELDVSPIAGEWDYNNPCMFCGCIWLKSQNKHMRSKCCSNGNNLIDPSLCLPPFLSAMNIKRI